MSGFPFCVLNIVKRLLYGMAAGCGLLTLGCKRKYRYAYIEDQAHQRSE